MLAFVTTTVACQRVPEEAWSSSYGDDSQDDSEETFGDESPVSVSEGGDAIYECDPVQPDTCPDGSKCTPVLQGALQNHYRCVNDRQTLAPDDACVPDPAGGVDGCISGYACLSEDDSQASAGVCLELCKSELDCDTTGLCLHSRDTRVPYCAQDCNPLESLCPDPMHCQREQQRFTCKFADASDIGVRGQACDGITDIGCVESYVCERSEVVPGCSSGTGFCCTPVCALNGIDECGSSTSCNEIFDAPAPGFERVGACYLPY